jgi:AraC-like DNA-binding protein
VLVVPLRPAVIRARALRFEARVDTASWLLLPAQSAIAIEVESPVGRWVELYVHPEIRARVLAVHGPHIDPAMLDEVLRRRALLPRTVWVHEIIHRYYFERAVCGARDNEATRFLETEIVKELFFVARDDRRMSIVHERTTPLSRALAHIEEHLFEAHLVGSLVAAARASESTLLRAFRREFGVSPAEFVRARRLDEALVLLRAGRYDVSEVARLVGYRSLGAFSQAFRARFGQTPSHVLHGTG